MELESIALQLSGVCTMTRVSQEFTASVVCRYVLFHLGDDTLSVSSFEKK